MLIDDNPSYALECAAAGINVLLYDWEGAYPWSKLPSSGWVANWRCSCGKPQEHDIRTL